MELDEETAVWYRFSQSRSKFGGDRWVEFIAGNSPIVICVPHGGLNKAGIPDRPGGCHEHDAYSLELGLALAARMTNTMRAMPLPYRTHASVLPSSPLRTFDRLDSRTESEAQHPHVIICHLARSKMDPNRDKTAACMGNSSAEEAWELYHGFVTSAIERAWKLFGYAHVFDVHGQSHRPAALELGYCLTGMDLNLPDDELNRRAESSISSPYGILHGCTGANGHKPLECSLMTMFHRRCCADKYSCDCPVDCHCTCCGGEKRVHDAPEADSILARSASFSELIRGKDSLGALISERGYPAVPSPAEPSVEGQYFWGAYTARAYGLQYTQKEEHRRVALEACVNSTQLEPPMYMREPEVLPKFAEVLAESIVIWMARWYGPI